MDNFNRFKKDFKQDMLIKVIVAMRHDRVTQADASYLATRILEIFKEETVREVFKKINKLSETNPEIVDVFIKRGNEYDDRKKAEEINQIQIYFKNGAIN